MSCESVCSLKATQRNPKYGVPHRPGNLRHDHGPDLTAESLQRIQRLIDRPGLQRHGPRDNVRQVEHFAPSELDQRRELLEQVIGTADDLGLLADTSKYQSTSNGAPQLRTGSPDSDFPPQFRWQSVK